jgi:hypothetical protein
MDPPGWKLDEPPTVGVTRVPCYEDLSPLPEFGPENASKLVAVGWLGMERSYPRGEISEEFMQKLIGLLVDPWQPVHAVGLHDCPFCRFSGGPRTLTYRGTTIAMGAANLFVPAEGRLYIAPSLIAHYIDAHEYAPPTEFCRAVMECPPMRSMDFLKAILQNGPESLISPGR